MLTVVVSQGVFVLLQDPDMKCGAVLEPDACIELETERVV